MVVTTTTVWVQTLEAHARMRMRMRMRPVLPALRLPRAGREANGGVRSEGRRPCALQREPHRGAAHRRPAPRQAGSSGGGPQESSVLDRKWLGKRTMLMTR